MSLRILGISAFHHDSAACLLNDGKLVGAAQEERFTRIKGDSSFPHHAIGWCLEKAGCSVEELDYVVYYERPLAKFDRLVETALAVAPRGLRSFLAWMPEWLTGKLWLERDIAKELNYPRRIQFVDHHLSHAASAFYPSPFDRAAILTIDGVSEWSTASWGIGDERQIELKQELRFPNSLGLLYSAFTHYCGFRINSGDYKLMGLAPYGQPVYLDRILGKLVRLCDDGTVLLNQNYFNYTTGLTMTNRRFDDLFGGPPRAPESPITQREMDLAASIQQLVNQSLMRMARYVHEKSGEKKLVLAGGVALNCIATGELSSQGPFEEIWTQPAAGDAGGALGAALALWHLSLGHPRTLRRPDGMRGGFLGPNIPPTSLDDENVLKRLGAVWESLQDEALQLRISNRISEGAVVAIARGPMEFGPRALGARSILGDARSATMQSRMNLKVKFRESFRPFAPMVLAEDASKYFTVRQESPYMLLVYHLLPERRVAPTAEDEKFFGIDRLNRPRSELPAITHVDYSAWVQTVDADRNPFMTGILQKFRDKTGCSVIVNTSFNVRGEPIVCTAEDAYRCFMATEIDCLVVGNRFLERSQQSHPPLTDVERSAWLRRFALD